MNKTMLIFDDDIYIQSICALFLKDKGWDVDCRLDCNNILDVIDEVKPAVILMDNGIPDTGGIIATHIIKADERFKNIPVIYCSGNDDIENLSSEAGADGYIEKPFDFDELEKIIEQVTTGMAS